MQTVCMSGRSSDMGILRLMIIYNVPGYSILGNPLIRDPQRRLYGKAISCVANQWKGSRWGAGRMRNRDKKRQEGGRLTRRKGRTKEKRANARNIERRDRKKGQDGVWERRGNISLQSPGREFGPSHETATSSLSFIRINLLNVSPTITHAVKPYRFITIPQIIKHSNELGWLRRAAKLQRTELTSEPYNIVIQNRWKRHILRFVTKYCEHHSRASFTKEKAHNN